MLSGGFFLQEMLVLYGMGLLGFAARKKGILDASANDVITQLVLYITLPALIIFSLNMPFTFELFRYFGWLIIMSVYILVLSSIIANRMRKKANLLMKQEAVYESLILFGNQGYVGFAVVSLLFGQEGIVYLTIFNACYIVHIWSYGIYLFTRTREAIPWGKIFLNPGIISTLFGLLLLLSPVSLPVPVAKGLESTGNMTIPLSMIMIGVLIADIKGTDLLSSFKNKYLWIAAFFRLLLLPMLLLPFLAFSIPFPVLMIAILVSGMPCAPTISLYSQKFGADTFFASLGVILTTVLCMLTIPALYLLVQVSYKFFHL